MKLYVLYTRNTPADRDIAELERRLAQHQITPELVDADSREGIAMTSLYDVMTRPSVLITDHSGGFLQKWEGMLPTLDEVMAYKGS